MMDAIRNLGGARAATRLLGYGILGACGFYRQYQRLHWDRVQRLVFVCKGNICRSPYAAELARVRGHSVFSFGLDTRGGDRADGAATRVARLAGVDLSRHASSRVVDYQPGPGDLLLAMEPEQMEPLRAAARDVAQVTLLGLWCHYSVPYLPDPYGRRDACFERVFALIDEAITNVGAELRRHGSVAATESAGRVA
jgi:protein-tyrosine phosphatase